MSAGRLPANLLRKTAHLLARSEEVILKKIVGSEFTDTASVEVQCTDGSIISIYYLGSELDWLIYNDPAANADLILNGSPEACLETDTVYMLPDQGKS